MKHEEKVMLLIDSIPSLIMLCREVIKADDERRRWERIKEFRASDPVGFALCRIRVEWDTLNSVYKKSGISDDFKWKRTHLKQLIAKLEPIIGKERLEQLKRDNPDREIKDKDGNVIKVIHGYNFKY